MFLKIAAKLTAFEAIDSLDVVKCFPEIHGDQQMNVMLNKLIGKLETLNPLSANPTKWPNTLKQFVGKLPTNCLSVFGHFVNLALKGLTSSLLFASPLPLVFFLAFTVSNNLYTTGTNIEDHIIKFGR